MIRGESLSDVVTHVVALLEATVSASVVVHAPPTPSTAIAAPALLVALPQPADETPRLGCANRSMTVEVTVIASNTLGNDLLSLTDTLIAGLASSSVACTWRPVTYSLPTSTAPLPAVVLTLS